MWAHENLYCSRATTRRWRRCAGATADDMRAASADCAPCASAVQMTDGAIWAHSRGVRGVLVACVLALGAACQFQPRGGEGTDAPRADDAATETDAADPTGDAASTID